MPVRKTAKTKRKKLLPAQAALRKSPPSRRWSASPYKSRSRTPSVRRAANNLNLNRMSSRELGLRNRRAGIRRMQQKDAKKRASIKRRVFTPRVKLNKGKIVVNNSSLNWFTNPQGPSSPNFARIVHESSPPAAARGRGKSMSQRVATAAMGGVAVPAAASMGRGKGRGRGRGRGAAVPAGKPKLTAAQLVTAKNVRNTCRWCGKLTGHEQFYTEWLEVCRKCGTVAKAGNQSWVVNQEGRGPVNSNRFANAPVSPRRSRSGSRSRSRSPKK